MFCIMFNIMAMNSLTGMFMNVAMADNICAMGAMLLPEKLTESGMPGGLKGMLPSGCGKINAGNDAKS